jgi:nucleotide-binding universal stress UspA family protein
MAIKYILVQVDELPASPNRLQLAIHLAHRLDARLIGAFLMPTPDLVALADSSAAVVALAATMDRLKQEARAAEANFTELLRNHDVQGEWRSASGLAAPQIPRWANAVDLVVLGQTDPDNPGWEAPETIILSCGRPVLVVPYAGRFDRVGESVLIAWNGSRESSRAMHDALPLMARSSAATALSVNPGPTESAALTGDVVLHLARHGLQTKAELVETKELAASDVVLSRVADLGADLVVMGAYGHSRLREMILGGMTREILRHMTVPVLMAH